MAAPRPKVRLQLRHRGLLGEFGYKDVKSKTSGQRRAALRRAAESMGWQRIVQRLNVLYIFNRRRRPATAALFREDRDYASAQLSAAKPVAA